MKVTRTMWNFLKDQWDKLGYFWWTPSAFRNDWVAYAKNVIGHFLVVGFLPALFLGWAGVVTLMTLYTFWELSQWWLRNAKASDCVEDWGIVLGGSLLGATLDPGYGALVFVLMVANILWRVED